MQTVLFIILFLSVPIVVYKLLKQAKIQMFSFAPVNIFLMFYWINGYLGILPLFFRWDDYRVYLGVTNRDIIFKILILSSISILIVISVVVLFLELVPSYKYGKTHKYSFSTNKLSNDFSVNEQKWISLIALLFIFCVLVLFLYLKQSSSIPILTALKGGNDAEIASSRSNAGDGVVGGLHWYNLFMTEIAKFIMYYFVALLLTTHQNKAKYAILSVISLVFNIFVSIMNANKVPIVYLMFSLLLLILIINNRDVNIHEIILIVSLGIVLLLLTYKLFFNKDKDLIDILSNVFSRMFTGSIAPAYFYIYLFPNHVPYLIGSSFPNPAGIFSREYYAITREVMDFMISKTESGGVIGSAPMVFWGEAYANYGVLGVLFSSFLVAVVLFVVTLFYYEVTDKLRSTPKFLDIEGHTAWSLSLLIWLFFEIQKLTFSGISRILFNINIYTIVLLYAIGLMFMKKKTGV